MLKALRVRSRAIAALLMVSLATALAYESAPGHAAAGHDAACAPLQPQSHSEADHLLLNRIAGASGAPATHCLVCHWARTFRPISPSESQYTAVLERHAAALLLSVSDPAVLTVARPSLRSPPGLPEAS